MPASSRSNRGFTLVELIVTITVILILVMLAVPSFTDFRHRSAIRGASERALSFWNEARLEAAKRNAMVKFGVATSGTDFCLGAATTTDASDSTACDCFEDDTAAASYCNVAQYPGASGHPGNQAEWDGVTVPGGSQTTLGGNSGVVVIEPKRTALTDSGDAGGISFDDPDGSREYRVNLLVDGLGRGRLCGSTSSTDELAEYENRQCAP